MTQQTVLGRNIERMLGERGKSNAWLAKEIGMNAISIGNLITGKVRNPRSDKLSKIARVFGVSMEDLIGESITTSPQVFASNTAPLVTNPQVFVSNTAPLVTNYTARKAVSLPDRTEKVEGMAIIKDGVLTVSVYTVVTENAAATKVWALQKALGKIQAIAKDALDE